MTRAVARIDTAAIERNCARLRAELRDGALLCAVVKANGYGHGAVESARAARAGGAAWLAVAAAEEARQLRAELPDARILLMGALSTDELQLGLEADADVAVWDSPFAEQVASQGAAMGVMPRVHVKHDSGMGRLGEADPDRVREIAARCNDDERIDLVGLWTHFATADEDDRSYFNLQLERFAELVDEMRTEHPGLLVHAANSAATLRAPEAHFDMVRCGIAIYGLDPYGRDPAAAQLEPALELRSWVAAVKRFPAGTSAGYGRRWAAPADTWVGVLPIGYGDGFRRDLTNNGEVLIRGHRYPIAGTVSMDNITVDLGPQTDVSVGDEAVLIGEQDGDRILCEELASRLGTINYEITCGLSSRVPREPA